MIWVTLYVFEETLFDTWAIRIIFLMFTWWLGLQRLVIELWFVIFQNCSKPNTFLTRETTFWQHLNENFVPNLNFNEKVTFQMVKGTRVHNVKIWKFTLSKKKKYQTNYLVISIVKPLLLSRNFWQKSVRVNFRNFHIVTLYHSVEIAEILSHTFFAKISWKQWFYWRNY